MELPILNFVPPVSPSDLVRHYHKLVHDFTAALAEPEQIDIGVAFCNPELPDVTEANGVFDAALSPDVAAGAAIEKVEAFFRERGVRPLRWVMNSSAPMSQTAPVISELSKRGFVRRETDILHLTGRAAIELADVPDLMIIPARSAFRHAQELAMESTDNKATAARAMVQHLDVPRFDALLALVDGRAIGRIGVLAVGDLGLVAHLYVSPAHRERGIESILLSRAIDFCARSGFKHVLAGDDGARRPLLERNGFERVGAFNEFVR
ncbi:MAG TPA: GNAT family N-acetyltransferase [Tepidisphaeraceae bacterium]|jgi:GNAT superfamily N-acetyltransferase|nr:GNAT family N-acetyltransferase [Tepidisphaeraceae bacterium]